jgi:hypothetical protein
MKYHKQVTKAAAELLEMILAGKRLLVMQAPMQSGKTELIACLHELLKRVYPRAISLYVTAHNHLDFVAQNFTRLEHLQAQDLYCLGLRERRRNLIGKKPLSAFDNDPVVVHYDENHFGDAAEQTIFQWLTVNKLYPGRKVYLIGISATPFSSVARAKDAVVRFSFADMPNYKSVTWMLEHGKIRESAPLILGRKEKRKLNTSCEAFEKLTSCIESRNGGYAILRIPNGFDAAFVDNELSRIFKSKVYVRHWNQQNQIQSPKEYFETERSGVFTVVIVQQKARMGNTIPTQYVRMVYEYSPNAAVATIAQSLLGRCCGHGKLNHDVTVFSHLRQAEAYSLFESGQHDEFVNFLKSNRIKASQRSMIEPEVVRIVDGQIPVRADIKRGDRAGIIRMVRDNIVDKCGNIVNKELPIVRWWDTFKKERPRFEQSIAAGKNPTITKTNKKPGSLSIYVDNRVGKNVVYYAYRTGEVVVKSVLVASNLSLYSKL